MLTIFRGTTRAPSISKSRWISTTTRSSSRGVCSCHASQGRLAAREAAPATRWAIRSRLGGRQYSVVGAAACPSCAKPLPAPASDDEQVVIHCPSCNAFLPPSSSTDYFTLFSLPVEFPIDKTQLRRKWLQLQGLVHPDRLPASASGEMRQRQANYAASWSAIVNEAYKTLSTDRLRGEYLLQRRGVAIEEQDKLDDPELLMEIMEVREELAEAQSQEQVAEIRDKNTAAMKEKLHELASVLTEADLDDAQARNLLIRLRYLDNVENVCREWQPGKDIRLQH